MNDELIGKTVADKYRIDSLLCETSLGALYRGWNTLMDKPVTVTILSPALAIDARLVDQFLAEAKKTAHITNENVLNVVDFGTDSRSISYTVYEDIDGETLRSLLDREGSISLPIAISIAKRSADALAAAHDKGVIHGQLSPERILVAMEGETAVVKLFDIGSKTVGRGRSSEIQYLAPDTYSNDSANDARSDVYSLGVILYEMLTGTVPFEGRSAAVLIEKQSEPPPPLSVFRSDLPVNLEPIVLTATAVYPDRRYQTMAAFAEDLDVLSASLYGKSNSAGAAGRPRRNIWQTAFIVLFGISVLAVALIYATSGKKTDPTVQLQADAGSLPVQPIGPATGAQEESLARLPSMTDAEIMATAANMAQPPGTLPGGDGYNAWANGGAPPPGAPPANYVQPGGQYYTIDPNTGSPFMPSEGGVVLVPVPVNTNTAVKPSPTPKNPAANAAVKPSPIPDATPKPLAVPPGDKPAAGQPAKPTPAAGKGKNGKRTDN